MKRFLFLFAALIGFWAVSEAQTIVSTQPSNRNVVLEEYTGIYCGYCPDGHRIATELKHANEGRFYAVNIHTGGYAAPQTGSGHPDLRTTAGDQLAVPAGIQGYPMGSVNRSTTPWAMSRNQWAATANNILSQSSPVNIGVAANVDLATRELTVKVEYYYTANEANPTNNLTVLLTQSEIVGYQANGAAYNPDYVTADGLYRHQHALRMAITSSVWGDQITQTTSGTFGEKEYKVTLPESITNIDLDITNLEVVAFISQGQANIITAGGAKVDIPAENKVMLSLEDQTVLPTGYFFESLNPVVKVTNNFDTPVTQFDLTVDMGGVKTTKTFNGTLANGESTIVDFGQVDATFTGNYSVSISGFGNINNSDVTGNLIVDWSKNDNSSSFSGIRFARKAFAEQTFGFETGMPANVAFDMTENDAFTIASSSSTAYGAEGTRNALLFYLHESWGLNGKPAKIMFGEADLTSIEGPAFVYHYAYSDGGFGGTAPSIKLEVSEDDGANWTVVKTMKATSTAAGSTDALYVPKSSEYVKEVVSLNAYAGKTILIKYSLTPGTSGNSFWADEFGVVSGGGATPEIAVNVSDMDFDKVQVNTSSEKTFEIANNGQATLSISSLTVSDDPDGVFEIVGTPSSFEVAAGEKSTITVKFTPKSDELYISDIIINSNDSKNPTITLSIFGEGEGTSVSEEFVANSSLKIMPNPVANTATLDFNYTGNNVLAVEYTLADISGKTVANLGSANIVSGNNTLKFDVTALAAGKYFLVIKADNSAVQQISVVVEK